MSRWLPKLVRKNHVCQVFCLVYTLRLVYWVMSPLQFLVPPRQGSFHSDTCGSFRKLGHCKLIRLLGRDPASRACQHDRGFSRRDDADSCAFRCRAGKRPAWKRKSGPTGPMQDPSVRQPLTLASTSTPRTCASMKRAAPSSFGN